MANLYTVFGIHGVPKKSDHEVARWECAIKFVGIIFNLLLSGPTTSYLTLLFISSSFAFISHLTNFLSYTVFMYITCSFCLTLPLRKNLLGSKRNWPLTFILFFMKKYTTSIELVLVLVLEYIFLSDMNIHLMSRIWIFIHLPGVGRWYRRKVYYLARQWDTYWHRLWSLYRSLGLHHWRQWLTIGWRRHCIQDQFDQLLSYN